MRQVCMCVCGGQTVKRLQGWARRLLLLADRNHGVLQRSKPTLVVIMSAAAARYHGRKALLI
jgi:hypothetical protein